MFDIMFDKEHVYSGSDLNELINRGIPGDPVLLYTIEGDYFGFYQGHDNGNIKFSTDSRGKIRIFSADLERRLLLLEPELVVSGTHQETPITGFVLDIYSRRYDEQAKAVGNMVFGPSSLSVAFHRKGNEGPENPHNSPPTQTPQSQ